MIPGVLTEHRDTDWNTGEVTTYRCSPDQHHPGRGGEGR